MAAPRYGPKMDPPFDRIPAEDERELLERGTQSVGTLVEKLPVLGAYLPVDPVQRYTYKKWAPDDWSRHNENKYFQANRDKEASRTTREEAKELMKAVDKRSNLMQTENTEMLGDRIQNINYWKFELERGIEDMKTEIGQLGSEIRRLEIAIQSTSLPLHICKECLANRQRRIDTDLVQDPAEINLLKEMELISHVRDSLSQTLEQAREQMTACRRAKEILEFDWSDKFSAYRLESKSVGLKNSRGNHSYRAGVAIYHENESDPQSWLEFSQKNLREAEKERESSIRLRGIIVSTLSQTSSDMRNQADQVEEALNKRVAETEEAVRNLETELKTTVVEIVQMEKTIADLNQAHWDKQAPLKVVQTRLGNRHERPNVEKCRDEPAHRLIEEVHELEDTLRKLELKTEESEVRLRNLQHIRLALEKEIDIKRNSLMIDRDRCLAVRTRYPSTNVLCGYR